MWFGGRALGGGVKAKAIWKYHRCVQTHVSIELLLNRLLQRLSGYFLFPLLLATVDLGGGFSQWGKNNVWFPLRLVAYVVAPLVCFVAVLSRIRYVPLRVLYRSLANSYL